LITSHPHVHVFKTSSSSKIYTKFNSTKSTNKKTYDLRYNEREPKKEKQMSVKEIRKRGEQTDRQTNKHGCIIIIFIFVDVKVEKTHPPNNVHLRILRYLAAFM